MDFSILEEKMSAYGSGGYYLLEYFIIELLKAETKSRGQNLKLQTHESKIPFDAFAPDGLGEINLPVLIEILMTNSIDKMLLTYKKYKHQENKNAVLLLISPRARKDSKNPFFDTKDVIIWNSNEIQLLIEKHPSVANNIIGNPFSNRLKAAIESKSENWKEERNSLIDKIKENYQERNFSMFLGAGVSSSAGIPDWNKLLNSLFVSMLTKDLDDSESKGSEHSASVVKRLRDIDGPSALTLARYIRKGIATDSVDEQDKFIVAVTDQLYGLRNKKFSISSELIKSIAGLCVPSRTGANVRSIITYNFDDLIERELKEKGLAHKSIFEEMDLASLEELPIYHVHGFLPEDRSAYHNIRNSTLVFSEEGYHHIYRDAYHWSNLIQLNSLKETTCIMVGLSLTDPNLRRLLEISAKSLEKPKHYAFMRRVSYERFTKEDEKLVVRAPAASVRKFLERHHNLSEEVMRELGVNVIWYEDYDEIPKILREFGIKKPIIQQQ